MDTTKTIVTHDDVPLHVASDMESALVWLQRHQGQSAHYALSYGGWALIDAEIWEAAKAVELKGQARQLLNDPWHQRGHDGENDDMTRSNCGACVLRGYRGEGDDTTDDDGPNYSGWARVYVEASRPIPAAWKRAFAAVMADGAENQLYRDSLRRDVATWGVRFQ